MTALKDPLQDTADFNKNSMFKKVFSNNSSFFGTSAGDSQGRKSEHIDVQTKFFDTSVRLQIFRYGVSIGEIVLRVTDEDAEEEFLELSFYPEGSLFFGHVDSKRFEAMTSDESRYIKDIIYNSEDFWQDLMHAWTFGVKDSMLRESAKMYDAWENSEEVAELLKLPVEDLWDDLSDIPLSPKGKFKNVLHDVIDEVAINNVAAEFGFYTGIDSYTKSIHSELNDTRLIFFGEPKNPESLPVFGFECVPLGFRFEAGDKGQKSLMFNVWVDIFADSYVQLRRYEIEEAVEDLI